MPEHTSAQATELQKPKKSGVIARLVNKLDDKMKASAEKKSQQSSCCSGNNSGGKCC